MNTTIDRLHTGPRMSKIVRYGGVAWFCGQTSSGTAIADVEGQTREVLARVDALLTEVGSDRGHLLAATVHLRDIADFAAMNSVWEAWLPNDAAPARTTVQALLASAELRVEITVVAACAQKG